MNTNIPGFTGKCSTQSTNNVTTSMHFTEQSNTLINNIVKQEQDIDESGVSTECAVKHSDSMGLNLSLADIVNNLFKKPESSKSATISTNLLLSGQSATSLINSPGHGNVLLMVDSTKDPSECSSKMQVSRTLHNSTPDGTDVVYVKEHGSLTPQNSLQSTHQITTNIDLPGNKAGTIDTSSTLLANSVVSFGNYVFQMPQMNSLPNTYLIIKPLQSPATSSCSTSTNAPLPGNVAVKARKESEQGDAQPEKLAHGFPGNIVQTTIRVVRLKPTSKSPGSSNSNMSTSNNLKAPQNTTSICDLSGQLSKSAVSYQCVGYNGEDVNGLNTVTPPETSISNSSYSSSLQPIITSVFSISNQSTGAPAGVVDANNQLSKMNTQHVEENNSSSLNEGSLSTNEPNITTSSNSHKQVATQENRKLFFSSSETSLDNFLNVLKQTKSVSSDQNVVAGSTVSPDICVSSSNEPSLQTCLVCHKNIQKAHFTQHTKTHVMSGELKCPKCDQVMVSYSKWESHQKIACQDFFKCMICGKEFIHKHSLQVHQSVHSQERPFKCHLCGASFKHRHNLNNHFENLHPGQNTTGDVGCSTGPGKSGNSDREYKCSMCSQVFRTSTGARKHKYIKHAKLLNLSHTSYQCHNCNEEFQTKLGLTNHLRRHKVGDDVLLKMKKAAIETGDFKCVVCKKILHSNSFFLKHLEKHQIDGSKDVKVYTCPVCSIELASTVSLSQHLKTHSNQQHVNQPDQLKNGVGHKPYAYKCSPCLLTFPSKETLRLHIERAHNPSRIYEDSKQSIKCYLCARVFYSGRELQKHQITEHRIKPFSCDKCGTSFTNKESLKRHLVCVHGAKGQFNCSLCGKSFGCKSALSKHNSRKHSNKKPFKCTICDKAFNEKRSLTCHQWTHSSEKQFKCSLCDAVFKHKSSLHRHQADHQVASDKPFQCTHCYKGFNTERVLKAHLNKHRERTFKCSICDKNFANHRTFTRHRCIHSSDKTHQCSECPTKCRNSYSLKIHVDRVHLNKKQFKCTLCKCRFKDNMNLMYHIRKHKCQICGKKYKRLDYVVNHMRVHSGERPFKCVLSCSKVFLHRSVLIKHQEVCQEKVKYDEVLAHKMRVYEELLHQQELQEQHHKEQQQQIAQQPKQQQLQQSEQQQQPVNSNS